MDDDKLNFLDETSDEVETEEPEQVEEVAEQPEPEPEAVEAAEDTGEEQAEPPSAEDETQRHIPVTALLDEREKRQEAQRKADEALARLQAYERQMQQMQQPQQKPDFFDNPEQVVQQQVTRVKLEQSQFLAEREFGKEAVEKAIAFFDDPANMAESQRFINHPSPYHAAVEHVKRQKFLQEVQDPDKWREQERERLRQEILAEAKATPKPKAPPPSMASAPARGGDAIAPGNAFDAMLGDS